MNLLSNFRSYIFNENLFQPKEPLLLAVSGGVDSVVLCDLCRQAGFIFAIAHCNFGLRGAESVADEALVKQLAANYAVPFFLKHFNTSAYAEENKVSIQVAARELRYGWFNELISEPTNNLRWLLTAHHADDNMETILMNFFKGSGIDGMKGMLPKNNNLLRPLLFAKKEVLLAYAAAQQLTYREDASNQSDKYTRNYFRNQLIPGVEKVFPQVKENILHNAERFRDIRQLYMEALAAHKKKLCKAAGTAIQIPVQLLLQNRSMPTVLYEIIKDYGFTAAQAGEVEKLLFSESGKYVSSATHRVLRNRKWLLITPVNDAGAAHFVIAANDAVTNFPGGVLHLQQKDSPGKIDTDPNSVQLDAKDIRFPLLLRKWKTGDYFYPLGMEKKKKLSRFFIDQKLSLHQKENTWVLESNKRIIWVAGLRIDNRFKLTPATTSTLQLRLTPAK